MVAQFYKLFEHLVYKRENRYVQFRENHHIKELVKTYKPLNESCSQFEINQWVLSDFIIRKLTPIVGIHPYPLNELLLMTGSLCRLKPTHIFEWGTHIGKSARIFYETSKKYDLNIEIHSIDLPNHISHVEHPGFRMGILVKNIDQVHLHQGDGLEVSLTMAKTLKRDAKILFFVDGDHSYETVKRELTTIMTELPAANVLLHDTFYQSAESRYNVGPYQAIQYSLDHIPHDFTVISLNAGLPGMTLLYHH